MRTIRAANDVAVCLPRRQAYLNFDLYFHNSMTPAELAHIICSNSRVVLSVWLRVFCYLLARIWDPFAKPRACSGAAEQASGRSRIQGALDGPSSNYYFGSCLESFAS
jgi:hypothetical protein